MEYKKIKINLNDIEKTKKFIQVVRGFISDVNIMTTNSKKIDAKSILGVFELSLDKDTYVEIISDNIEECRRFDAAMEEFK